MFSKLPKGEYIDNYFIDELPPRRGIWRIKKPFRVMSRLFDKNVLVGYVLYSRPNQHCYVVRRSTFVKAIRDRAVEQLKLTSQGIKERGSLKLECLPYHQVTSKKVESDFDSVIRSFRQERKNEHL